MKDSFVALIVLGSLAAIVALARLRSRGGTREWPVKARPLLTSPEQVLYQRLRNACPEFVILSQVALSQMLVVRSGPGRQAVFNRISQLVADFVVCRADFTVHAVIELDDRSHDTPKRAAADARKNEALKAAGISLYRFNVSAIPTVDALQATLLGTGSAAQTPPLRNRR